MTAGVQTEYIRNAILANVQRQKMGLAEAAALAKSMGLPSDLVDAVVADLQARADQIQTVSHAVIDHGAYTDAAWYLGPIEHGHWSSYFDALRSVNSPGLHVLDEETTRITALLANPHAKGQRRKGLVMGNVQSGKTRNFAGVVAKAADAGYRFVIILSGMHNNLREQTQARLDAQLFHGKGWYPLTTALNDFEHPAKPSELFLHQPVLCAVVKKNSNRLGKLVSMLADSAMKGIMTGIPVLIVDDEADQATPNSLREKDQVSTINQHLRNLWGSITTGTYLAYTATPFANVLMDPDNESDLFPSDFITTLEPGDGYFGAERVFGLSETVPDDSMPVDGLDMVREIPLVDAAVLKPPSNAEQRLAFDPDPPPSMLEALDWFIVATAIRRARGQAGHSSMLVHTTHYADPHFAMREQLDLEIHAARSEFINGNHDRFLKAWQREAQRVAHVASQPLPSWASVQGALPGVLDAAEVIVDNGSSDDRLNYDGEGGKIVVAVGGGTLSRGLTLEGLTVSYFTRTSNTYDTLLQMGRWFGYRNGYEDLPRIWVTKGLDEDYSFLARVEKDLRAEIQSVQASNFTPEQVGVKIRSHPGRLAVTSANRMYDAKVVQLGLSGTASQTFLLDGRKPAFNSNKRAVADLLKGATLSPVPWSQARWMGSGFAGDQVAAFIENFAVHEAQDWLSPENRLHISEWIGKWANGPVWNVILVSNSKPKPSLGTVEVGGYEIDCLDRSPLAGSTPDKVNLKAVMSSGDRIADIDPAKYGGAASDDAARRRIRRIAGDGKGLVLVYPLSSQAKAVPPKAGLATRMDMPTDQPLLAFSIFYPFVNDETGEQGSFISVRRTWDVPDMVEGDDAGEGEDE